MFEHRERAGPRWLVADSRTIHRAPAPPDDPDFFLDLAEAAQVLGEVDQEVLALLVEGWTQREIKERLHVGADRTAQVRAWLREWVERRAE